MKKVFSSSKTCIRTGFRRTKNLKGFLVPSALPEVNSVESVSSDALSCFRCDRKVCDACHNFLLPAKRIKSVVTGKSYKIRQALSCRTFIVPYAHSVINSVLDHQLNSGLDYPTTRVISNRKRGRAFILSFYIILLTILMTTNYLT